MTQSKVHVRGLNETVRAFREVDADLPKELRVAFKAIAEHVAVLARSWVPRGGSGVAAASIRARATQRGAGIAFPRGEGRGKADYYPWLDFGGTTGRGHSIGVAGSGSIKRDLVKGGRYVYPAIADSREFIGDAAGEAIERAAHGAGFMTRGS